MSSAPQAIESGAAETSPAVADKVEQAGLKKDEVEYPRVYVGNLPFSTTEDQVREHVSKVGGEIVSVVIPTFGRRPAGYAFVAYKTQEAAQDAVEKLKDTEIEGRKLTLEVARSKAEQAERREAIVSKRKEDKDKRDAERKEKGETVAADGEDKPKKKRPAKRTSRRRQPGEEGEDGVDADKTAVEEDGSAEKGRRKPKARQPREARIDQADGEEKPKKESKPRLELTDKQSENTIFVSNLPFSVDDAALAAIFTDLSIRVKSAKVIKGIRRARGGRPFRASRGFGFVEVEEVSQQKEAVDKVDGSLIGDRKIGAKIAQEMKPIEQEQAAQAAAEQGEQVSAAA